MARRTTYRPPTPTRFVEWPADWGQRFTIFVDTEEEFDWDAPLSRQSAAVTATAAIPEANGRFADLGAPLTYLVDYPIATTPRSIEALRRATEDGRSAIGTQLHPWVNPPFDEALTPANSFAGNLPRATEAAKLDALGTAIATAFGTKPRAYRAGRYGIGPNTMSLLAERGYRIDTSVRARYDYARKAGPDFSGIGNAAYRTAEGPVELPLSTAFIGVARRFGPTVHRAAWRLPHGAGLLARAGLVERIALTPEEMPLAEAIEAVRVLAGEGLALLNFSFHSPSLAPGHTPYVRDAADLAQFWRWWDAVLALLDRLGVRAASLDQLLAATKVA